MRPSCFAIPTMMSFTSPVCRGCGDFDDCRKGAYSSLLAVEGRGILPDLLKRHQSYQIAHGDTNVAPKLLDVSQALPNEPAVGIRRALTRAQSDRVNQMPKKAGIALRRLMSRGRDKDIRERAGRGENPFCQSAARPCHFAFEKMRDGVTKAGLRAAYCGELGWTEKSAFAQVTLIWNLFQGLEIAKEENCKLEVKV